MLVRNEWEALADIPDGAVLKVFSVGPPAGAVAVPVGGPVDDVAGQLVDDDKEGVQGKS